MIPSTPELSPINVSSLFCIQNSLNLLTLDRRLDYDPTSMPSDENLLDYEPRPRRFTKNCQATQADISSLSQSEFDTSQTREGQIKLFQEKYGLDRGLRTFSYLFSTKLEQIVSQAKNMQEQKRAMLNHLGFPDVHCDDTHYWLLWPLWAQLNNVNYVLTASAPKARFLQFPSKLIIKIEPETKFFISGHNIPYYKHLGIWYALTLEN